MEIDKDGTEKLFKRERIKGNNYELKEMRELVCKKWLI
jgi:hypothetical protein